jgi:DNA-binding beta-propeller fold protein YncE
VYVALNGVDEIAEVDLERWRIVRRFPTDKGPYNVEVTSNGEKLLVSYKSAGAIGIWDIDGGRELAHIPSSRSVTHGVVISPDSRYGFVSSEGKGAEAGTVDVIDMVANEKVCTVEVGLQAGGIAFWRAVPHKM